MDKNVIEFNNIKEIVYNSAIIYKDNIAYVNKTKVGKEAKYENITFAKLLEDINAFGTKLYNMGYKGKRVAVIGKNRYEWVVAHFSNLLGSNVSVPLDKDLQIGELESSVIRAKVDVLVFDEKQIEKIEALKANGNTQIKEYICMSKLDGYNDVRSLIKEGRKLIENVDTSYTSEKIDENALAILLFTSGTTSQSKAVMLSHKNVASNVYALQLTEDIRSTDTNIAFLPFHHIFGSTCNALMIAAGVRTVFPDGLKYIKQNLNEYQVSLFVGVPVLIEAMYKTVMKEIEKQGKTKLIQTALKVSNGLKKVHIDITRLLFKQVINALGGKLRLVISGGAPADPVMAKGFSDFGIEILQGYGLSETAPVVAAETHKYKRFGSIGKPMPNVEVKIDNPDSEGIGELIVRGPNIMLGYYEMEELTRETIVDGWFHTGDLAYIDKDGYIFITGRSKNMIVLKNGKKIFPEELETIVSRPEFIEECMVFGMPDKNSLDKNDVKLSVKVVYNKEYFAGKQEYEIYQEIWEEIKRINQEFPKYKHIKNLLITDEEMIKTSTKKVKRPLEMEKIMKELEEK